MRILKIIGHVLIIGILTILTQIGGVIWLLNFLLFRILNKQKSFGFRITIFGLMYFIATFVLVPKTSLLSNRVQLPITRSGNLIPHSFLTVVMNRNYVRPKLMEDLIEISNSANRIDNNLKVSYLDANFPFINGFPLLPHLSHSDGRKIDLAFFYTKNGERGTLKPSNLGYGIFEGPKMGEVNQTDVCKKKGYWQYDYTKYLTLGHRGDLEFDEDLTRRLIERIVRKESTEKLLIEPHLKNRMKLTNSKIRFQGCRAVRHDDHIHYQVR